MWAYVTAQQFAKVSRATAFILAGIMSASPSLLQGQCQPVAGASEARPPEPHNTAPGKPPAGKPDAGSPEFYDEPKFNVAGVTDTTNLGGHGSGTVQRNTEALTKEAILLKKESPAGSQQPSFDATAEKSLRESLEHDPGNAGLHHSLADTEEKLGNALGANDRALRCLFDASDLNPSDPTPYLFLGKMQNAEIVHSTGFMEKMERFSKLQPENPLANYYYAVALWKRANDSADAPTAAQIESLLNKAIHLNPKLDVAYLQLGILYGAGGNFPKAIAAYQKARDVSPELEEPHYRLADAYRRVGEKTKAEHELQLFKELTKKKSEEAERERHEIQQFVFALRDQSPAAQQQPEHQ